MKIKKRAAWNKGIKMWDTRPHPRGGLGKIAWNKGLIGFRKGYKQSEDQKRKIREAQTGVPRPQTSDEKNPAWKGDLAGKVPMHKWVIRKLGQPDTCEFCGRSGLKGHSIQWANIDHTYRRDLSDYMRLCVPCHRLYDSSRGVKTGR